MLFPEPDKEQQLKTQAVFNVFLWKELFKKNKKELPKEGLWIQLKNITGIDPATAKNIENKISNWYVEDVKYLPDDFVIVEEDNLEPQFEESKSIALQTDSLLKQTPFSRLSDLGDVKILSFDKYQVSLPKGDLKQEWEKLKQYMDIKL